MQGGHHAAAGRRRPAPAGPAARTPCPRPRWWSSFTAASPVITPSADSGVRGQQGGGGPAASRLRTSSAIATSSRLTSSRSAWNSARMSLLSGCGVASGAATPRWQAQAEVNAGERGRAPKMNIRRPCPVCPARGVVRLTCRLPSAAWIGRWRLAGTAGRAEAASPQAPAHGRRRAGRAAGRRPRARRHDQPVLVNPAARRAGPGPGRDVQAQQVHAVIRTLAGQVRRSGVHRARSSWTCRGAARRLSREPLGVRVRVAALGRRLPRRARRDRGRRRHRGAPGRPGPPRLRGQRQPRAEDPGRRAALLAETLLDATDDPEASRRFAERIHHESPAAGPAGQGAAGAVPAAGRRAAAGAEPVAVDRIVHEVVDRTRTAAAAKEHRRRLRRRARA